MKVLKSNYFKGFVFSFLSAFLYGLNVPIAKYYLNVLSSSSLLFLLYLGSTIGMFIILLGYKKHLVFTLSKIKIIYLVGVIICDIIASLLIVSSLNYLNASVVSLLSIFEIAATVIASKIVFKNKINKNLIISLICVSIGGILLSFDGDSEFKFSLAILFVLGATLLWGFENNFTAKVSEDNPILLVFCKCLFVTLFNLIILFISTNSLAIIFDYWYLLIIGFFTYGVSILFFAYGTKYIGASKTSIIFSLSPIFSTFLSLIIFKENLNFLFIISFIFMLCGMFFNMKDT